MKFSRIKSALAISAVAVAATAGVAAADQVNNNETPVVLSDADAAAIDKEFADFSAEFDKLSEAEQAELLKAAEEAAQAPEGSDAAPEPINLTDEEAAAIDKEFGDLMDQ